MNELYTIIQIKDGEKKIYRIKFDSDSEYAQKCFALLWTLGRSNYINILGNMPTLEMVKAAEPDAAVEDWDSAEI